VLQRLSPNPVLTPVAASWGPPVGTIFRQISLALRPRGDAGKIATVEPATRHHLRTFLEILGGGGAERGEWGGVWVEGGSWRCQRVARSWGGYRPLEMEPYWRWGGLQVVGGTNSEPTILSHSSVVHQIERFT
jgi:hypothetical protein